LSTNSVSGDTPRLFAVYDVLIYTDPVSGAVLPEIATSMTTSDAVVWTMKIRPNVKFTDGTPYDAPAVKFNWDRQRDPANAATGAAIVNGMTYEVVDSLTLKMTLKVANGQFPRQVADYLTYIGSPAAITAAGSQTNYTDKPVGAGPFILKQWVRDSQATYVRNPNYWNSPRPYVDQLVIKTVLDETQRKNTMIAGGADLAFSNNPSTIADYKTAGVNAYLSPSINTNIFYMNERVPALGDVRVRKALQLAIDLDQLNKVIDGGIGEVPHGYFPPNFPYSDPSLVFPSPDLVQAQKYIDAYVAENGGKDLTFEFLTSTSPRNQNYYAAIKQMVEKLNHVHMTLKVLDAGGQLTALINHDFTIHMSSYPGTDPEPGFLERVLSNGTSQYIAYSNADVDKNVALSRSTTDPNVRNTALKAIQKQMITDVPFFPLFRSPGFVAESSKVRDLSTFNDGALFSDRVWLKTH
jgi:peptide/nickel transport system substrate-binding protein